MDVFATLTAIAAPLMRPNIDTEVVVRIDRLMEFKRGELGPYCFESWRFLPDGADNPDFAPNQPAFRGARILVCAENFGCGSSREAAVWSLMDYGVRCVIAPSFGDIFAANCLQNGLLAVTLDATLVETIAAELEAGHGVTMTVDLVAQLITAPSGRRVPFAVDPQARETLLEGLDEIGLTLRQRDRIIRHQHAGRTERPWMTPNDSKARKKLLVMAGDGIGKEIMAETMRVAAWFAASRGIAFDVQEELFGLDAWHAYGSTLRPEGWTAVEAADAILFGASGGADYTGVPDSERYPDRLLMVRLKLDLFDNLRPVKTLPALGHMSSLRPEVIEGCDMVIVRELIGGVYFSQPKGVETLPDGTRRGFNTMAYTTPQIERIARSALALARSRKGQLCSVDKANVLDVSMLWREVMQGVRDAEFPDVALTHMYVDNAAMQLVRAPRQFDVLVTENLFGDILSDCAAMVAGSIGLLPSASFGPVRGDGTRQALYEPIHGSAPDIAGKGVANPLGAILSFALCLRHTLGRDDEAKRLERAVESAVAGGARTADIAEAGSVSLATGEMCDAVIDRLEHG